MYRTINRLTGKPGARVSSGWPTTGHYEFIRIVGAIEEMLNMEIWTGVACIVANPNCKGFRRFGDNGKGAYVNLAASADSRS